MEEIEITAQTNGGLFSVNIPLKKGLNIIRAENSSGKSTCVNAIAYGLGLEHILGPSRKRPFPKSLYEEIFNNKEEQNPFFVSRSGVSLMVDNHKGRKARLSRDIAGNENKITVVENETSEDYFLGVSGNVGSAKSEKGFHYWLADFIGWKLPDVVTYEGKEVKLYLECIFPLFFIEQKRGWSEIQANIPGHYGIKNVKKAAVEFCLGIDGFEQEKKVSALRLKIEESESEWKNIIAMAENVADFHEIKVSATPLIENYSSASKIEYYYLEGDAEISIQGQEIALKRQLELLNRGISNAIPQNEKVLEQQALLRGIRRNIDERAESIELAMMAVNETETKLKILSHDLDQYQQLRKLKSVGSDISDDLDTQKCPICESDLYDTLGERSVKRQPMTLEENIEFLKSQIDFFESVMSRNVTQLRERQKQSGLLNRQLQAEAAKLEKMKEDIDDINGATRELIRERILVENSLSEAQKLRQTLEELNDRASSAFHLWSISRESLRLLRKQDGSPDSMTVIRELEAIIKANLSAFGFNPSAINSISISLQTFRPEQEGYDIVAETSASDYIRIIWSYTLALMELAGTKDGIKHGGFVVFDEPRQHEASRISFASLVEKAAEAGKYNGQVIFATSLDEDQLISACTNKDVNLFCFDNYILRLQGDKADVPEGVAESPRAEDSSGQQESGV
ncbi:MAG: hypothetical protein RQ899_12930 [Pseudomonadales bacterium]|nr:hypothetical protein [Pseudomonadales bacterium]